MNTRITLSAALAATALFALAPAQAQAPSIATSQLEAKVQIMQSQINALQAQVQHLQQQLIQTRSLAGLPNPGVSPFYRVPNSPPPNSPPPNFTAPNFTAPNVTLPNNQMPLAVPQPQPRSRDNSIPNYTATFINQTAR